MKKKNNNSVTILAAVGMVMIIAIVACVCVMMNYGDKQKNKKVTVKNQPATTVSAQGNATSTAVVVNKADENKSITIQPVDTSEIIICVYSQATMAYSRHGEVISIEQIHKGDVVDVTYDSYNKQISTIKISDNDKVWENTKVTSFSVDNTDKSMKIGQTLYRYTDNTLVFLDDDIIDITELYAQDQLIVRGYDKTVVSVVVEKSHGYISLTGESLFLGGLIDVGGSVVKVIEDDMLIIVREGSYKVEVRNGGYLAEQNVTVKAGEHVVADFSGVTPTVTETGSVSFNINADGAKLYVDGQISEKTQAIVLTTGKHNISVEADGYETYTSTINVTKGHSNINITLGEKTDETITEETTGEAETETKSESGENSNNTVTVKGPEGGYVYVDGAYKGVAPVTFPMVTGSHVISIINNKEIKSYTVTLIEGANDVTYDFTNFE